MTIDMDVNNANVAQYELFTYEEFVQIYPISEDTFNAFNAIVKVAIGKGIVIVEMIDE